MQVDPVLLCGGDLSGDVAHVQPGDEPGNGLMERITTPREGSRAGAWPPEPGIPAPLRLHETLVKPEWADYNGHMSESVYLLVFGDSADAFFRFFGIDEDYRASGRSLFTVETHLRNLREAYVGDRLRLTLQVLGVDTKRLHILHEMLDDDDRVLSTAEQLLLHVDTQAGRVAAFPDEIGERLQQIRAAHEALPVPAYVGRVIQIPGDR
jgi:acyl-CoA thioester hydrolase